MIHAVSRLALTNISDLGTDSAFKKSHETVAQSNRSGLVVFRRLPDSEMRVELLLIALLSEARGTFVPPGLVPEVSALRRNDYVAYAALHGMKLTYHEAVTPDGWILKLWRVRSPRIYHAKLSTPVIVSHGCGSSAFDYMRDLRNESTAFVLADNGYDTWLTNYRATQFSNRILSKGKRRLPKPKEYYRASWQYMADLDFPTIVDKVLAVTKQSKFYVIGHSMGTTVPFAFLSRNHTYDHQLSHLAAVVPVLRLENGTSTLLRTVLPRAASIAHSLPQIAFELVFGRQLLASTGNRPSNTQAFLQSIVCCLVPDLCGLLVDLVADRDLDTAMQKNSHYNATRAPIYSSLTPGGVTMMNIYNFALQWDKEPWRKIDFNFLKQTGLTNLGEYRSVVPPRYDFGAIKVGVSLFFSDNDIFTGRRAARELIAELKATDYKFIAGRNLNHLDAVIGYDARCYTINDILSKFERLENKRDERRKRYRRRVRAFVNSLPFEDGCVD